MFVVAWEIYWGALCQLPCQLYLLNVNDRNERIDESIRMPWIYKLMRPSFFSQFQKQYLNRDDFHVFFNFLYFEIINRIIFGLLIHEYLVHKKSLFQVNLYIPLVIWSKLYILFTYTRHVASPPPPIFKEVKNTNSHWIKMFRCLPSPPPQIWILKFGK